MGSRRIYGEIIILAALILSAGVLPTPALAVKVDAKAALHPSARTTTTTPIAAASGSGGQGTINSNSVLVALLDSHYTELAELVEKALLLQTLEEAVGRHNVTIFAPRNEALERDLDPEFKRFLLEPGNLRSLQTLLLSHVVPTRLDSASGWPAAGSDGLHHPTLNAGHRVHLRREDQPDENGGAASSVERVDLASIVHPDAVVRPDGVIHGIERLLVPRSVQEDFNRRRSLAAISAVLPVGAPEVDPRTHRLKHPAPTVPAGSPPALPIYDAMAPGPSLAPAPQSPGAARPRRVLSCPPDLHNMPNSRRRDAT